MIHIWKDWYFETNKDDPTEKFYMLYVELGPKEYPSLDFEGSYNTIEKMFKHIEEQELYELIRDLEEDDVTEFYEMVPEIDKKKDFLNVELQRMCDRGAHR